MGQPASKEEFYSYLNRITKDHEAVKEIHNMDERPSLTDHKHSLTLEAGNSARCNCGWGIYLDNTDEIKDGHLFKNGTLII